MKKLLLIGLTALLAACNPLYGTQGLHVHLGDFTAGTTRHPQAYDDLTAKLEHCAQRYILVHPMVPYAKINAPLDSLVRGGIWIVTNWADVSAFAGTNKDTQADGIYQRGTHRLFLTRHAFRLADEVTHEIAHALSDYYPSLRNPEDVTNIGGELDHRGEFFRECVTYNPTV